jgi:hypothetical protein
MRYFRGTIVWSFVIFVVLIGPTLLAQAAAAGGGAPVVDATANEWGNSFIWAFASSWVMRWLREHPKVSFFSERTILVVQRAISVAIGFLNGLGISFVFDQNAGQLVISGLFLTAVLHGARQFIFQEFVYQSALQRATPRT